MVKTIFYEGTIALGTSIDFRNDLRRYESGLFSFRQTSSISSIHIHPF